MFVDYDKIIDVPTTSCAINKASELAHNDPIVDVPRTQCDTENNPNEAEESLKNESIIGSVRHFIDVPIITIGKNDENVTNPTIRKSPPAKEQKLGESAAGWVHDATRSSRFSKTVNTGIEEKNQTSTEFKKPNERKQSFDHHARGTHSPANDRYDKSRSIQHEQYSGNRRSRSRESTLSKQYNSNQYSKTPPRYKDERINTGRYDNISSNRRSPDRSNMGRFDNSVKNRRSLSNDSEKSHQHQKGGPEPQRSSYGKRYSGREDYDKDKYVLRSEYKGTLAYINKLNRNYNGLLQMFVNEIANKNLMRNTLLAENTVPTFDNIIESSNRSSSQTIARMKREEADEIGSSSKQDDSFEESYTNSQNERNQESSGRQERKSNSNMNFDRDGREYRNPRKRSRLRSVSREYRNYMANIELSISSDNWYWKVTILCVILVLMFMCEHFFSNSIVKWVAKILNFW